jgi:nucleoside-diphosphate-sugar epimerase
MRHKRIIVAGVAGRVGGSIAESLVGENEVFGFDLFHMPGSREGWEAKGVRTFVGDLTKGEFGGLPQEVDYCIDLVANTFPGGYRQGLDDNALGTARLMGHCKKAKAFLTFSSSAVYTLPDQPDTPLCEDDLVGSKTLGFYPGSKIATEGAVRVMAHFLQLPSIMLRMTTHYGTFGDGGLLVLDYLNCLVSGIPVRLLRDRPIYLSPIYEKDVCRFMQPLLEAATTQAPIVNLCGDDSTTIGEIVEYMSELTGIEPKFDYVDEMPWPSMIADPTLRRSITGDCRYSWREGIKELVEYWQPRLSARSAPNDGDRSAQGPSKFGRDTRIKEIIALPGVSGLIEKYTGQKISPVYLKLGANMTLQKAGAYMRWSAEQLDAVIDEINALTDRGLGHGLPPGATARIGREHGGLG